MTHPYASLTPDLVMDAIESLDYRCNAHILELNSYENRVYQIGIENQEPVIAKFYRENRWTDEQIIEEHAFTQELKYNEITVIPPLQIKSKTLHHYESFRFSLYQRRGGRAPELDNIKNLEVLGRFIGRIHQVGKSQPFEHRPEISVQEYGYLARQFLIDNKFIYPDMLEAYSSLTQNLLEDIGTILEESVERIRLHGDCHMGNVLWRDDSPHFVDFDDSRSGPAIQDLWMMLSGDRDAQSEQMRHILRGYQDFAEFDFRQLALIEVLRTLRIMHHSAWIAQRWGDPAFPRAFPFFNTPRYWSEHILGLREQWAKLSEPSLQIYT